MVLSFHLQISLHTDAKRFSFMKHCHLPDIPTRRDANASRRWLGWARLSTVLLNTTIISSYSRRKAPVSGWSCVLRIRPSLIHCQNCVCVVQNCLRSRQITSAVFFFFFFLALNLTLVQLETLRPELIILSLKKAGG